MVPRARETQAQIFWLLLLLVIAEEDVAMIDLRRRPRPRRSAHRPHSPRLQYVHQRLCPSGIELHQASSCSRGDFELDIGPLQAHAKRLVSAACRWSRRSRSERSGSGWPAPIQAWRAASSIRIGPQNSASAPCGQMIRTAPSRSVPVALVARVNDQAVDRAFWRDRRDRRHRVRELHGIKRSVTLQRRDAPALCAAPRIGVMPMPPAIRQ